MLKHERGLLKTEALANVKARERAVENRGPCKC